MSERSPAALLSVVVPAFDEELRIEPTLRAVAAVLDDADEAFEIIVSDDGSRDGTVACCERLRADLPTLRVLRAEMNRGKGAAVRRGMLDARGDVHAFLDADGSTEPRELLRLVALVRAELADVAIASRYVRGSRAHGQPLLRVILSRVCNAIVQASLLPGIADPHCGMKVFTRRASVELFGAQRSELWSFDVEILARARRAGLRVTELPVAWQDDARTRVRWGHAWPTLVEMIRIHRWLASE